MTMCFKRKQHALIAALAIVACICNLLSPANVHAATTTTPVYRLYKPSTGRHIYTASAGEKNSILSSTNNNGQHEWVFEGVAWWAPKTGGSSVYRLYNPNSDDHLYTTSVGEKNTLVNAGWQYEGVAFRSGGSITVYRLYGQNSSGGFHFYTTSVGEKNALISAGYTLDSQVLYADSSAATQTGTLTFNNDPSYGMIEATVKLNGSGSGKSAKLNIGDHFGHCTALGLYYEQNVSNTYPSIPSGRCFVMENVMGNIQQSTLDQKEYMFFDERPNDQTTYKLRLTFNKNTKVVRAYINDVLRMETVSNLQPPLVFSVEGSACKNGDSVSATFTNVRMAADAYLDNQNNTWYGVVGVGDVNNHFGITATKTQSGTVNNTNNKFNSNGYANKGSSWILSGTINRPGNNPATGQPWNWDTCYSAPDPTSGNTTGHAFSSQVSWAQRFSTNNSPGDLPDPE